MATRDLKFGSGWKGTIGAVVESSWNGIRYLRSKPAHYRDCKSVAQLTQREKMSQCHTMVNSMLPLVQIGYREKAVGMSAYNVCMSRNMRSAMQGTYPHVAIEYDKVLLGEGPLAIATDATAKVTDGRVTVQWNVTPHQGNGKATDKALVAIYNVERANAILWLRYAKRADGMVEITLPKDWVGAQLELFIGFENSEQSLCSNIVHVEMEAVTL